MYMLTRVYRVHTHTHTPQIDKLIAANLPKLDRDQQETLNTASGNVKTHQTAFEDLGQSIADWLKVRAHETGDAYMHQIL
jgi:hypothetical protein